MRSSFCSPFITELTGHTKTLLLALCLQPKSILLYFYTLLLWSDSEQRKKLAFYANIRKCCVKATCHKHIGWNTHLFTVHKCNLIANDIMLYEINWILTSNALFSARLLHIFKMTKHYCIFSWFFFHKRHIEFTFREIHFYIRFPRRILQNGNRKK